MVRACTGSGAGAHRRMTTSQGRCRGRPEASKATAPPDIALPTSSQRACTTNETRTHNAATTPASQVSTETASPPGPACGRAPSADRLAHPAYGTRAIHQSSKPRHLDRPLHDACHQRKLDHGDTTRTAPISGPC